MEDKFYNDTNPGGKYLVTKQELLLNRKVANESVTSISMDEIFKFGKSKTYVLKLDIEGFGCKEISWYKLIQPAQLFEKVLS